MAVNAQTGNRLYINDVRMSRGSEQTISIGMDNETEITAVEFVLHVPDGFSVNPLSIVMDSSRSNDHEVTARAMGNNNYKVMVFSPTNSPINGMAGTLFTATLIAASTVTDETEYQLVITDAVMTVQSGANVINSVQNGHVTIASIPNLHVISLDCSNPVAGSEMTVRWKVRNDGRGNTGNTEWKDYVWLVPDIQGNSLMTGVILLATVNNVSSLQSGEYYEKSINVQLQERIYGNYYLVVTSDMYRVTNIDFSATNNQVPDPYEPETAAYGYLRGYANPSYDKVQEEGEQNGWSDNFFYKAINIAVPPLPDLQVTKVTVVVDNTHNENSPLSMAGLASSTAFYSGKHVLITATITNKGGAPVNTTTFINDAYISSAENHEDANLIHLSRENLTTALGEEESVNVVFSAQIPYDWSGDTWFLVYADTGDAVYELANTENNWGHSMKIDVLLTPGADFEVSNLSVPSKITSAVPFDISYSVANIGPGVPYSNTWTDKVYLSRSASGLDNSAICVGTYTQKGQFVDADHYTGDNYTVTRSITPSNIQAGTYYVYVSVDSNNNISEYDGENNNIICSDAITCVVPDLTPEIVSIAEDVIYGGGTFALTWKLKNIGAGDVVNKFFRFNVNACSSATGSNAISIGYYSLTVSIPSGGEKIMRCNVTVPENSNIYGNKYINVSLETNNFLIESNTSNNYSSGIPRTIKPRETGMNLSVTELIGPSLLTPDTWANITYKVTNTGTAAISQNVNHVVYLSDNQNLTGAVLCEVQNTPPSVANLQSNGKISVSQAIKVPANMTGGTKYIYVVVDPENVLEEAVRYDNSRYVTTFYNGNLPDLVITEHTIPDVITTSTPTQITLKIENQGQKDAESTTCQIALVGSNNSLTQLTTINVPSIKKGESAEVSGTITLRDNIQGSRTLSVKPNYNNKILTMKGNDRTLCKDVTIVQAELPDLVISDLEVEGGLRAGEKATVRVVVTNNGDDDTHITKWTDQFYLSTAYSLNTQNAIYLGEKAHVGKLGKNESYEVSVNLNIPSNIHGYYFLYAVADGKKANLEKDRSNNTIRTTVNIENRNETPADLSVVSVTAPSRVMAGELISISYTITNNGQYLANGTLRDVIYLSKNATWDENDIMVGVVSGNATIEPGNTLTRTANGRITNVVEGNYYFIVKTNSTHTIAESDYNNNHAVQSFTSAVDFTTFLLGSSTNVNTSGYFKLPVSGNMYGKTIGFYLNHDEDTPAGLYVSYDDVPSTAHYDFSSTTLQTTEQEVLVPNVQEGTYYILAQANAAASQNVNQFILSGEEPAEESFMTFSAHEVPFGATSLSIKEGGTDGWLSTEIHGALLDSIMDFRLVRDRNVILVEAVTFNDQTFNIATFNLIDAETGSYDVISELPNGTQAVLADGFRVVPGQSVNLGVKLELPNASRSLNYAPLAIAYANGGNTDIAIKELLIVAEGATLAETIEGLKDGKTEIHVVPNYTKDRRGYVSIPPGTQEVINCFIGASNGCTVTVYVVK
jgi:hypothetical protein